MPKINFKELNKTEQLRERKSMYKRWALSHEDNGVNIRRVELEIAKKYMLSDKELKEIQKNDKWESRLQRRITNNTTGREVKRRLEENVPIENKSAINDINQLLDESNIPERWKVFIMYYLHSYNVGYAAQKAGYTTGANCSAGFKALRDPRVKKLLKQIKEIMYTDIYVTGRDILTEYIKIAFADMTQYVEFDNRRVRLKNSDEVDGRLITEVRQGKDGVTIKLADKMKALEKLEKLFDIIPDRRLELDREKFNYTKQLAEKETQSGNKVVIINDL